VRESIDRDLQNKLSEAFGLGTGADVESLIAALRSGANVDPRILRQGCLALVDHLREARLEQAESHRKLELALESSSLGLWEWNIATGEMTLDHTYCKFLGREKNDTKWSIEALAKLVHPDDAARVEAAAVAAIRNQAPIYQVQHRVRHSDGRWVWLETYGMVIERTADGKAVRMAGTNAEITDRKQTEIALSNTLRVMHTLLETLPLPVTIREASGQITLANAAWLRMYGVSRDDVIGKRLEDLRNRAHTTSHLATDAQMIEHKQPMSYETTIVSTGGETYNVLIAKTPLIGEDGTVNGIASVITDISAQKRIAANLDRARLSAEAAVHAKSIFLANMSHELRTPLNGVVGMASLLENTALDAKQRRFVRTLKSSAEALITLINDVLDLSKAEAGKLELERVPFDLRKELEQVIGLFGARANDKSIELAAHIARDVPPTIEGDPVRLRQVLGNLVNNAVKFTDSGAVLLAVATAPAEGRECVLEFSVTDTGLGIGPEERERIFEAFEQADGSVTRKFGGTGLGLTISRQLVELMHGSMGLDSEPGRGSRFSFRIPVGVPRVELPDVAAAPDLGVVVIGLHPVVRSAVCDTMSADAAHVISVDSAIGAVEALADFSPRVSRIRVVVDSNAAARLEHAVGGLRAAAAPRQLEVIALLPPDADAVPPAGVNRVIVKPLCTADLLGGATTDTSVSLRTRVLPVAGSRGRALVVEDNAVNQEMARAMLDMLGFTVSTASNGRDGVAAAVADPDLDLILMDCQMPVMDGLAAARAIRQMESAPEHLRVRVPIVALTGNAMPGDREACVAAGMDDYLAKPFSLAALKAMLDKWTGGGAQSPARRKGAG
jgi:PAS domain S-box-containing protein